MGLDEGTESQAEAEVVAIAPAKRHILVLIPTLTAGGAERVFVTLLKHLDRRRFRLSLAVVDIRAAVYRHEILDDVEFIDLDAGRVRYALPKIIALIWKRRPDVVLSTLGHLNLALAMFRWLLPRGVKTAARETIVVSQSIQRRRAPGLWKALYRWFYGSHDKVVCQSQDMQRDLVECFDLPPGKAMTINNPVDLGFIKQRSKELACCLTLPSECIRLVTAGRMVHQKGFDLLIEAIASLNDSRIHLTLLGEGMLSDELQQLAKTRGIADQVYFAGFQSNPYAWLARADAFVLSSRYEGFPNVVLEALACSTPVIATPAPGGVREILDSIPECVVAQAISAQALAAAIAGWVAGPQNRVPDTAVAPYLLEQIVGKYETLLQEMAEK